MVADLLLPGPEGALSGMLHMREYAFFPCPEDPQYGLMMCVDDHGYKYTLRGPPDAVRMILEAECQGEKGFDVSPTLLPERFPNWPDDWGGEMPVDELWFDVRSDDRDSYTTRLQVFGLNFLS
jgi:hypothetical protein